MYLHYHDYLLDGRWVLTPGLDDDDRTALVRLRLLYVSSHFFINVHLQVRNLGDGFDDEECPERESWGWEMRSTRAPGVGIFITGTRSEPDPFKSGKKAWEVGSLMY